MKNENKLNTRADVFELHSRAPNSMVELYRIGRPRGCQWPSCNRFSMWVAAIVGMMTVATACAYDPPFRITAKRSDDKIEVNVEKDKAQFSVQSPFGISQAVIERIGKTWPAVLTLRLHLKGLENLKISNGKAALEVAISSNADKHQVRLWLNGQEELPLDADSPFWMTVLMVDKDGKPAKKNSAG